MTKQKSTKRALLMSALALLMCVSMLIGSTFAWFTDSVTSGNNKIVAGTLKVDLEVLGEDGKYVSVRDMTDPIFEYELWEPGYTEVKTLKIQNEGNLALKYQLNVTAEKADSILANVIDVYMCFGESTATSAADLADTSKWWKCGTLAEMMADPAGFTQGKLLPVGAQYDGTLLGQNGVAIGEITASIALHMQESAGNEYQGLDLGNIDITLLATQFTYEKDSFDDQYDKDAAYPVATADELADALANGEDVVLANDISVAETLAVPAGVAVKLDLNGKEIKGTVGRDANNSRVHTLVNNGTLTLVNGTVTSAGDNGGSAIYNAAGATLTIEDVTVNGAPVVAPSWPSYGINNYGNMTVNSATVNTYHGGIATNGNGVTVINDANVNVGQGTETNQTSWALFSLDNGRVTVNGGTFANTKDEKGEIYGGGYIDAESSQPFIVNGGTFTKTEDDRNGTGFYYQNTNLIIKGGIFDVDPSTINGVTVSGSVVNNGDGTWAVKPYEVSIKQ